VTDTTDQGAEPKSDASNAIMMDHLVTLTYVEDLPPNTVRWAESLVDGRIVGQKCPECGRVYVPPKGYCPLDVVVMAGEGYDVEVSDQGVVTGFTIVAPVKYYGQTKTEPFVYASVLLDGASGTLGGQNITGIAADHVHAGQRVKAVWKPVEERTTEGQSARGWGSVEGCISSFEPTGEPDMPREHYEEHVI
jgi:uncharacterized OB-fold protein